MEEVKQRQIAYVTSVDEIQKGDYVKSEGWTPSYVKVGGKELSRVNLIGVVVSTQEDTSLITGVFDDGTGMIDLLFFEKFKTIPTGKLVNLIGKVRQYNEKKAITPEIVKPLDNQKWIEVRKLQLEQESSISPHLDIDKKDEKEVEETIEVQEEPVEENRFDKICEIIRNHDKGEGADHQLILEEVGEDGEHMIKHLLREGEIFEISPGKLKVLD